MVDAAEVGADLVVSSSWFLVSRYPKCGKKTKNEKLGT